jgi:hypothetical protein
MSVLYGSTGPIGGSELFGGSCFTTTATVTGATVGMPVTVTPRTFPGNGVFWEGYVSAADTVTVKVCASLTGFIGQSIYDVAVNNEASGGGVDSVTATSPIASTGGANPDISYDGGTINMLSTSAVIGLAAQWGLGTEAGTFGTIPIFSPQALNTNGELDIGPSGTGNVGRLQVRNASGPNFGLFRFQISGVNVQFVTALAGTGGTGVSTITFGEGSIGAPNTLTTINFTFQNVTQVGISKLGVLSFPAVTGGLSFKSGSNARVGSGTLVAGTLVIPNTSVTANSLILVQNTGAGVLANVGALFVASQTAGVGFTVTSSNAADTSTFKYLIVETA